MLASSSLRSVVATAILSGSLLPVLGVFERALAAPETSAGQTSVPATMPAVVTLSDAVTAALEHNPELGGSELDIRVREAEAAQAGMRRNPELRSAVENVGGSGDREGTEATETTLLLSQVIELGGKRGKRERVALLAADLSAFDYEERRLTLLTDTTQAFIATLAAQERLQLSSELERVAREAVAAAERRVRAGAAVPAEPLRARVVLGRASLEHMRAARELEAARDSLAKRWGEGRATFARVAGQLERIPQVPAKSELEAALEQSPTLARWEKERAMRSAELALAQARRIPDVTVAAGGRYFNDHEDAAFVFEFGVPLPLFDRNRGAIEAARHQSRKVDTERAGARLAAAAALAEAHGELLTAHDQAVALREHVLPDAEKAKRAAHDALQRALFDAHEVLEAERTLFELRVEYVRVLERLHLAAAEVERLTARPLGEFAKAATP